MVGFFCNGFCHHPHLSFVICHLSFFTGLPKKEKRKKPYREI